jgi:hypothetical protein
MPRSDWSRALPRPLIIPSVTTLRTLADVRELMRHLPTDRRERSTWHHVAKLIEDGSDPADVLIAVRMVLNLEGVEYRTK